MKCVDYQRRAKTQVHKHFTDLACGMFGFQYYSIMHNTVNLRTMDPTLVSFVERLSL